MRGNFAPKSARDIHQYRLDWALLSPEPGAQEQAVFGGFVEQYGLRPYRRLTVFLFHTTALYGP
jgi:hypothetical protein